MITDARKTRGIIRRDTRANQPAAIDVLFGTIYYVTDEGIIERSNGVAWESYSSTGTPPTTPAGVDTQVQFNDGGVFGADVGFTYDKISNILSAQNFVGQVNGFTINQDISIGSTPQLNGLFIGNLQESNIADGSLLARLTANEVISGAWSFNNGLLTLNHGAANLIDFGQNGLGVPTFTTRSAGTKILLYPALSGAFTDYAIGMDGATMWFSLPTAAAHQFKFYGGTTLGLQITSEGAIEFIASVSGPQGSIGYQVTNGLQIRPKTGGSFDFSVVNAANSGYIITVPTGTDVTQFSGLIRAFVGLETHTDIYPNATNAHKCGTSALAWAYMYAYLAPQPSAPEGKIDIERSKLGLNFINALNPVQYRYTTRTSEQLRQGFLSTDVERIITEDIPTEFGGLVKSEEGPEHDALAYTEFIAPLVKAVQELSTLVTTLTEELVTLRARVTALESPR